MERFPPPDQANFDTPAPIRSEYFDDPDAAVARLEKIYDAHTAFLRDRFQELLRGAPMPRRVRATYPQIRLETRTYANIDSRLAYGHVSGPGVYAGTITRPALFRKYLTEQIRLLIRNHGVPVEVGVSGVPIPLHFAFSDVVYIEGKLDAKMDRPLRDIFDVPDLSDMDDSVVNGTFVAMPGEPKPLAPFTAPRVDFSLHRLPHYTATAPEHFQNFVLFTNYQFYVDEFVAKARKMVAASEGGYRSFVEPGNVVTPAGSSDPTSGVPSARLPQMPAYHLTRDDHSGITMVNIGVGPSNAKTITDHVAVLRPACMADARSLRRSAQFAGAGRLRAGARLRARGPRPRWRSADVGADSAAR